MDTLALEEAQKLADRLTLFMAEKHIKKCLCCAESMSMVSRTLNVRMADLLCKIARAVNKTQSNDVIPSHFTGTDRLDRVQYANINVLKKHGLIADLRLDEKTPHYCITRKGHDFVTGKISIPKTVWSFRNKTVRKSETCVTISDLSIEPYTDIRESLFFSPPTIDELDKVKVHFKVKKKARKNPCPNCETGEMKKQESVIYAGGVARILSTWNECHNCGFKRYGNALPGIPQSEIFGS